MNPIIEPVKDVKDFMDKVAVRLKTSTISYPGPTEFKPEGFNMLVRVGNMCRGPLNDINLNDFWGARLLLFGLLDAGSYEWQ